jgi:5-methyltetrahydropteroyltriglutamate--homocysteine methyltransferase
VRRKVIADDRIIPGSALGEAAMQRNTNRIRTSHVGRLPPPKGWEEMPARLANAEITDAATIAAEVTPAIAEIVKRQAEIGIDCIGDGEFWTARSLAHYSAHFAGVEARPVAEGEPPTTRHSTRERDAFPDFYGDMDRAGTLFLVPGERPMPPVTVRVVARGPVKSKGPEAINRQLDAFKAAIAQAGTAVDEAFVPVLAPGWLDHFIFNEYYKSEEEFLFALADALRVEYRAVIAAGFVLQIDDPGLPDWWDMLKPEPSVEAYRRFARLRIDAVNHALAGLPEEKVRYHLCWGSWHGPHTHDLPLEHIVDLILEVKAQTYSFEAANVRHEHEWRVWQTVKLPPGKMLMPGVVSHATNLVEHPQLVADRILRYAAIAGRENVVAGTDCGLGGRVHADLAWAKLATLVEGARLASNSLWP